MVQQIRDKRRRPFAASQAVMVVLFLGMAAFPTGTANCQGKAKNLDAFARCLTQKKTIMYGSAICPHCQDQKRMFGASFQYVTYVECFVPGSRQYSPACVKADVRAVPTWAFPNGARLVGVQPLEMLSAATGCPLP